MTTLDLLIELEKERQLSSEHQQKAVAFNKHLFSIEEKLNSCIQRLTVLDSILHEEINEEEYVPVDNSIPIVPHLEQLISSIEQKIDIIFLCPDTYRGEKMMKMAEGHFYDKET